MDFERKIAADVVRHGLMVRGDGVVVALSGGADSVALLAVLTSLGYGCVAAHCNFHLRGAESDRDEAHSRAIAAALGVEIVVRDFDVAARRAETGESVEMACRELRYGWFEELREERGAAVIAVGHHREDNVETFLLNVLRGTGVAGAGGIRWRRGRIVRPLLGVCREDIEVYLRGRGLMWVDDSSNGSLDYGRNRLRNVVIPALEGCFEGASERLARSIGMIAEGADFFEEMVEAKRGEYFDEAGGRIDLAGLLGRERNARLLLVEWLRPYGIDGGMVDGIIASAGESGRRWGMSEDGCWLLDRGELRRVGRRVEAETVAVELGGELFGVEVVEGEACRVAERGLTALFDVGILDGNPRFELRGWRRGDRIKPFGMAGSKRVSDLMRDARVGDDRKGEVRVLTRNGEIVWVIGLRHSRLFSVPAGAGRYLRVSYRGE